MGAPESGAVAAADGSAAAGAAAISGRNRQYFFGIWEACSFLFSRCAIDTEVK